MAFDTDLGSCSRQASRWATWVRCAMAAVFALVAASCQRGDAFRDREEFMNAKSEYDLANIPLRYVDVVLRDPFHVDFSKPARCTAYYSEAISTPWRNVPLDERNIRQVSDLDLIRELSQLKARCDLATKRADVLGAEIERRSLISVGEVGQLRGFGETALGARALILEANDGSDAIKERSGLSADKFETWTYKRPNYCAKKFLLKNDIVVGRNLIYCSPTDGTRIGTVDGSAVN